MIGDEADLALARLRAELARKRLLGTLGDIRDRLNPRTLAEEAWESVRERGGEAAAEMVRTVREKPGRSAAIAGAIALFMARRPIARGVMSLLNRGNEDETDGAEDGSAET